MYIIILKFDIFDDVMNRRLRQRRTLRKKQFADYGSASLGSGRRSLVIMPLMLFQCWAIIAGNGPTLKHHCLSVLFVGSCMGI